VADGEPALAVHFVVNVSSWGIDPRPGPAASRCKRSSPMAWSQGCGLLRRWATTAPYGLAAARHMMRLRTSLPASACGAMDDGLETPLGEVTYDLPPA
jgi:hypothetical protein